MRSPTGLARDAIPPTLSGERLLGQPRKSAQQRRESHAWVILVVFVGRLSAILKPSFLITCAVSDLRGPWAIFPLRIGSCCPAPWGGPPFGGPPFACAKLMSPSQSVCGSGDRRRRPRLLRP